MQKLKQLRAITGEISGHPSLSLSGPSSTILKDTQHEDFPILSSGLQRLWLEDKIIKEGNQVGALLPLYPCHSTTASWLANVERSTHFRGEETQLSSLVGKNIVNRTLKTHIGGMHTAAVFGK